MDDALNLAIFCDYDNMAIGAREAKVDFNVSLVIERLLDKGKIVFKKAYADWDRYRSSKRAMHEAGFEMVEIPHVSYSGKNSADIRLVVDALDLCYTKTHVDAFAILSGDSDFSPLVSKLRENNKLVIGVGIKHASSDLLIENCDDFIYYDELTKQRDSRKSKKNARRTGKKVQPEHRAVPPDEKSSAESKRAEKERGPIGEISTSEGRDEVMELVLDTVESLFHERDGSVWGSMVKQTIKRKRPNFSEASVGYRTFNHLLEDAQKQGFLVLHKDEKSGGYQIHSFGPKA